MDKISPDLLKKIDEIHVATQVMKETLGNLETQVTKQNSRVSKLEDSREKDMKESGALEERIRGHIAQDEKNQEETNLQLKALNGKFDDLSRNVYIGIGVATVIAVLGPYILGKIFG